MTDTHEHSRDEVVAYLLAARGYTEDERVNDHLANALEVLLPNDQPSPEPPSRKTVGDTVPDFELPGAGPDGIERVRLSDYTDSGAVILAFYPFDFSPICTNQLCKFRDTEWLTFTDDVNVFGISVDSAYSHQQFRREYNLPFPLLTDRLGRIADQFGVKYDEWEAHPAVAKRALFAIDETHTVRYRWHVDNAETEPSIADLEEAIDWLDA